MDLYKNALKALPPLCGALCSSDTWAWLAPQVSRFEMCLFLTPWVFSTHLVTTGLFLLVPLLCFPLFLLYS